MKDGRLHQATSLRRIAANVLLVLDVGNEISYAKRNKTTALTAQGLVSALQPDDSVAVIQYGEEGSNSLGLDEKQRAGFTSFE